MYEAVWMLYTMHHHTYWGGGGWCNGQHKCLSHLSRWFDSLKSSQWSAQSPEFYPAPRLWFPPTLTREVSINSNIK